MEKYQVTKMLGGGSFGTVHQARNMETGEYVAIKELAESQHNWNVCIEMAEVKALSKLNHPNIVKLVEVIKKNNKLYLVFEYLERNILDWLKAKIEKRCTNEIEVRNIMFQTLQGLYFMHRNGYMHRDLKLENILEFKGTVKIADFGLAKKKDANPPLTDYVSTRWYRAPELILSSTVYDEKVDIFAMGAIMGELYNGQAMFNGTSQIDQLHKVFSVLGTPSQTEWEEGYKLARALNLNNFPQLRKKDLAEVVPTANQDAIDLMGKMFVYDAKKRISALEALQHPYFMVDVPMSVEQVFTKVPSENNTDAFRNSSFNPKQMKKQTTDPFSSPDKVEDQAKMKQKNSTKYYLSKARYKPGVNLAELLKK